MTIFYNAITKGFYSSEIHGDNIPSEAVEITKTKYAELLEGQSSGKMITMDGQGIPVLEDLPIVPRTNQDDIDDIEAGITERRMREAILTPEGKGWLQAEENKIEAIRNRP